MALVFWLSVAVVVYVYVAYPLMLAVWARLRRDRSAKAFALQGPAGGDVEREGFSRSCEPSISIVLAARNEAARLAARIDNLLSLDYPAGKRQIIVVSDGSTDHTLEVLAPYRGTVDVVAAPAAGKAAALNAGIAHARHDILVFADARQIFAPDALRELAAPFADPAVGGVTGELLLDAESALFSKRRASARRRGERRTVQGAIAIDRRTHADRRRTLASTIADGVGLYWRYEKQMRRSESAIASTLGATGAIYAIRRSLWRPLPPDTILDDVLTPMRIVLAGYRMVFNERAVAFDRASIDADTEARRKVRTLAGNYQLLALEPRLLLPWRNPVWLQFMSHKVGRLAVPYMLLTAFASSIALAGSSGSSPTWIYLLALAAQVAFYLLAGYGAVLEMAARRAAETTPVAAATAAVREVA